MGRGKEAVLSNGKRAQANTDGMGSGVLGPAHIYLAGKELPILS